MIMEAVEQWNLRFSELVRKKDSDKKRDKHHDLDSVGAAETKFNSHESQDVDVKVYRQSADALNIISKKIKSLDQGEG